MRRPNLEIKSPGNGSVAALPDSAADQFTRLGARNICLL